MKTDKKMVVFVVRLDSETEKCLDAFAEATYRTRAQAVRTAIRLASRLFSGRDNKELGTQDHKDPTAG